MIRYSIAGKTTDETTLQGINIARIGSEELKAWVLMLESVGTNGHGVANGG